MSNITHTPSTPSRLRLLAATLALGVAALALDACTLGPDYQRPDAPTPERWSDAAQAASHPADPDGLSHWWTGFNDATLDALVGDVVAGNLDVQVAEQRILAARAQRRITAAGQYPSVNGDVDALYNRLPGGLFSSGAKDSNAFILGFDASWEADIFGGIKRGVEAADASLAASVADRRAVVVSVLAELGTDYAALRSAQERRQIADENVRLSQETRDLTAAKFKAGLASELEVAESEAALQRQKAAIPQLDTTIAQQIHAIAILTGQVPESLEKRLSATGPTVPAPPTLPLSLPSEVVRARPDIQAAERTLAASVAEIGVKEADRFPKFKISLDAGLESGIVSRLFRPDQVGLSVGPQITGPIFDAGRRKAAVQSAQAQAQADLLSYRKTVLGAFREVEDALVAFGNERTRNQTLHRALDASRVAQERARSQYRAGLVDFLTVLDADRTLASARDSVAQSDFTLVQQTVALYKALGGGWQAGEQARPDATAAQEAGHAPAAS